MRGLICRKHFSGVTGNARVLQDPEKRQKDDSQAPESHLFPVEQHATQVRLCSVSLKVPRVKLNAGGSAQSKTTILEAWKRLLPTLRVHEFKADHWTIIEEPDTTFVADVMLIGFAERDL